VGTVAKYDITSAIEKEKRKNAVQII